MVSKPDRNRFLAELENTVNQFLDNSFNTFILISHNDADGISSLHIIQNLLFKMNLDFDYFIYN